MLLVLPGTDSITSHCRSTNTRTGIAREPHRLLSISDVRRMNFGREDSATCSLVPVMASEWNMSHTQSVMECRITAPRTFRDYQIRSARTATTAMMIAKNARNSPHSHFGEAWPSKFVDAVDSQSRAFCQKVFPPQDETCLQFGDQPGEVSTSLSRL